MELRANELRIGNLVSRLDLGDHSPRVESVLELRKDKVLTTGPISVICLYSETKPIPLTEEWLLKLGGYESHGELRFNYYCRRNEIIKSISFDFLDSERFYFINDNGVTVGDRIDYVHQLQNLYFALTGEELLIK